MITVHLSCHARYAFTVGARPINNRFLFALSYGKVSALTSQPDTQACGTKLAFFRGTARMRPNMQKQPGRLFEVCLRVYTTTTLAKNIETTARTWRRCVISRACTRLVWLAWLSQLF